MAMTTQSSINRAPRPSSLADVLDLILDKGLVIDAYVRVSLVGIEILTIDVRVVVASVDTYLRFAEAVNRLDLRATETAGIPELLKGDEDDDEESDSSPERSARQQQSRRPARPQERSKQALPQGRSRDGETQGDETDDEGGLIEKIVERGRRN